MDILASLGTAARAGLQRFFGQTIVLPYNPRVAMVWGVIQAHSRLRGRPRPVNDSWIAACCIAPDLPLATLNVKDFEDYREHEGLELIV